MPHPLYLLVKHIAASCPELKGGSNEINLGPRAYVTVRNFKWWKCNFGEGGIKMVVPRDSRGSTNHLPDPDYHMLEGVEIYWVRWEIAFPKLALECFQEGCMGTLHKEGKMNLLKPSCYICDTSGSRKLAFTTTYKCNLCDKKCTGTSKELLHSLPSYCSSQFPVDASCARECTWGNGKLMFDRGMTRQFMSLGVTHVPAKAFAEQAREASSQAYVDAVADYFSQLPETHECECIGGCNCEPTYPSLETWELGRPHLGS